MTYVDGAAAVHAWVNSQTATLVGPGRPLWLGASFKRHTGAPDKCYGLIVELSAFPWAGHENPDMGQRISMQVYGPTKEAASIAAVAYANAVLALMTGPGVALASGVILRTADEIQGPQWLPDGDEPRYIVDADFYLS